MGSLGIAKQPTHPGIDPKQHFPNLFRRVVDRSWCRCIVLRTVVHPKLMGKTWQKPTNLSTHLAHRIIEEAGIFGGEHQAAWTRIHQACKHMVWHFFCSKMFKAVQTETAWKTTKRLWNQAMVTGRGHQTCLRGQSIWCQQRRCDPLRLPRSDTRLPHPYPSSHQATCKKGQA